MKKWTICSPDAAAVEALHSQSSLSLLSSTVLASQGFSDARHAGEHFACDALSDPFDIVDMREAADAINAAVDEGKRICIYGDYDCDGIMATVILFTFLQEIGADVTWYIPERSEGYGLNENAVRRIAEDGVAMIITVDNGISAIREAALIKELGMELIVTDHHQPGKELPEAIAVVDPHREDNYSTFRLYCGAGLALLLVAALNDGDVDMAMEQFADLAAIATIADVVTLTGVNRFLVQRGLDYLENTERPGLIALREVAGLAQKKLTSTNIAFNISPRINAAGRLASPRLAVELLLEERPAQAKVLAARLNSINAERQGCVAEIQKQVQEQLEADPSVLHDRAMVFSGEGWHKGVIGITAARVLEKYGKPVFVISTENGVGHGSARSFGAFSIFGCLTACADLLEKFGGHPAAGGFTIQEEKIPAFRKRVAEYAAANHPEMPFPELRAVCALTPALFTMEEVRSLSQLEPFGADNPEPLFFVENAVVKEIRGLSSGVHTKLLIESNGMQSEALLFHRAPEMTGLKAGSVIHMMVTLEVSSYMGNEKISMLVRDFRPSGLKQAKILSAMRTYETFRRGEALPAAYYKAICPTREECVTVYRQLTKNGASIEKLSVQMNAQSMNYCKLRICLDIFAELGLAAIEGGETNVRILPAAGKVDLQSSRLLCELEQRAKEGTV